MAQNILSNNNARSTLLTGITNVATSLSVQAGHGARFDSPGAGEIAKVTLYNSAGAYEIIHLVTRVTDGFTVVVRGQEGTTAVAWNAGDGVSQNATAGFLDSLSQLDRTETFTAQKTFSLPPVLSAGISGGLGPNYINNVGLLSTVAAKALTVAFKTKALVDPTSGSPFDLAFRNVTLTIGDYVVRSLAAAASVVAPSGATLGFGAAGTGYLYIYALDNAGVIEPIITGSNHWDEAALQSTTAISAAADSRTVLYSTTARTNVPIRYVGRIKIQTGAVAGEWDNEDTEVSVGKIIGPPAVAAGYSRVTPNMCRVNSVPSFSSLPAGNPGTITTVTGPNGALGLILELETSVISTNATGLKYVQIIIYSEVGGTNVIGQQDNQATEQGAYTAGFPLLKTITERHVKCDSLGKVFLQNNNGAGTSTAKYRIVGYYD